MIEYAWSSCRSCDLLWCGCVSSSAKSHRPSLSIDLLIKPSGCCAATVMERLTYTHSSCQLLAACVILCCVLAPWVRQSLWLSMRVMCCTQVMGRGTDGDVVWQKQFWVNHRQCCSDVSCCLCEEEMTLKHIVKNLNDVIRHSGFVAISGGRF